jgi:hypothetical protein
MKVHSLETFFEGLNHVNGDLSSESQKEKFLEYFKKNEDPGFQETIRQAMLDCGDIPLSE